MERTLSPLAAHNAVAALVELYASVISDYERHLQLANAQIARDKASHVEQLAKGHAENDQLRAQVEGMTRANEVLAAQLREAREA